MPLTAARKPAAIPLPPLLPAPFHDAIERGIANGAYASLAVGMIDGKRRETLYFGHRDGPDSKPADDDSQFEIGAISEVFTGLLLAQTAIEGRLRLSDPIEKFLPQPFPFADARTGKITLAQLATHHSGLPSQAANLFSDDLDDPYAGYAAEDLLALLAFQRTGAGQDDAQAGYDYSVLDAGLLGHLLGRVHRMPLGEALASKVFAPLGLSHLTFADDAALLPGHAHGEPAPHWHYVALAGAAGLRATLPDLLAFLQHNLTPDDSPLRAALLLARQPHASGPADQIGFGWNVREVIDGKATWPLVWRASRTAGFASFIGFRIDQQKAIVLLGNCAQDVAALGITWLNGSLPPAAPHGAATTPQLNEYPGLYRIAAGVDAIVRVGDGALSLQIPGQLPVLLHAADRDVFVSESGAVGATFIRSIDDVTGLMLQVAGNNISAARLSTGAPYLERKPMTSTGNSRTVLSGDYRLDDDTWIRIGDSAQGMGLQWTLGLHRNIFPYAIDRYADADGVIDFQVKRDRNGRVTSLVFDLAGRQREAVPVRGNFHRESR